MSRRKEQRKKEREKEKISDRILVLGALVFIAFLILLAGLYRLML